MRKKFFYNSDTRTGEQEKKPHNKIKICLNDIAFFSQTCCHLPAHSGINLTEFSQVKSSQVKSSQVKSSQVKSSQVKSSQVKSSQVKSSQVMTT